MPKGKKEVRRAFGKTPKGKKEVRRGFFLFYTLAMGLSPLFPLHCFEKIIALEVVALAEDAGNAVRIHLGNRKANIAFANRIAFLRDSPEAVADKDRNRFVAVRHQIYAKRVGKVGKSG